MSAIQRITRSRTAIRWREVMGSVSLVIGLLIVGLVFFVVVFGPYFAPYNPYLVDRVVVDHYDFEDEVYIRVPLKPSDGFLLGTDERGMDILSLLLHGARNTILAGILVAGARILLGMFFGLLAGWFEGSWLDRLVMGMIGMLSSLPVLISGLILIFVIGIKLGLAAFFIGLTVVGWSEVAQYIRGEVLVTRKKLFMEAARSLGSRETYIAIRHVIPNIVPQLIVLSFLEIGAVLMLLGELALLGVFIGGGSSLDFSDIMSPPEIVMIPTRPEWGAMISSGYQWLRSNPHIVLIPATALFVAVVGFNMLGEGLRARFSRRGVNTRFLFEPKGWAALAVLAVLVLLVFRSNEPPAYYEDLARSYSAERVQLYFRQSNAERDPLRYPDAPFAYAGYIGENLSDFGVKGGVRWSNFYHLREEALYAPQGKPEMTLISIDGTRLQQFAFAEDFNFVMDGYGAVGESFGMVTRLHFWPDMHPAAAFSLEDRTFEGKIVMLEEGNAPLNVAPEVLLRGAEGILWVMEEDGNLQGSRLEPLDEEIPLMNPRPVFRITHAAAEEMLAAGDGSLAAGLDPPDMLSPESAAFQVVDSGLLVRMALELKEPVELQLASVIGYLPGTDADLGDEIIVLVADCNGLWGVGREMSTGDHSDCAAPMFIELARLFHENVVDTRRPILYVIWGGGEFSYSGLTRWLNDRDNFAHLSAPGMRLQPRPAIVIQLQRQAGEGMLIDDSSSPRLADLLEWAADARGADLRGEDLNGQPSWLATLREPYYAILNVGDVRSERDGEAFSLALIRLLREDILSSD